MPNHVLQKDPAGPLTDADILYLIQGSGLDCDRKVALSVLRTFIMAAAGIVTTSNLADNAVTKDKMADNSVGAEEIINQSVGTAKLADNSVTQPKMADNSVGTAELIDKNVTQAKLADALIAWIEGRITDEVGQEALARGSADSSLANAINNEAITRKSVDNGLSQSITAAVGAEASQRESADTSLQSQVNALTTQITKLWAPTSSTQHESADGHMVIDTEFVDGLCLTVHPGSTATDSLIQLGPAPADVQVFHVRVRLPRTDTVREYPVSFSYPSALDNNYKAYSDFVFPQKAFWGSDDHDQFTPVYTFVRGGTGWILM